MKSRRPGAHPSSASARQESREQGSWGVPCNQGTVSSSEQLKAARLCMEVVAVGVLTRASQAWKLELKREMRSCTSRTAVRVRERERTDLHSYSAA